MRARNDPPSLLTILRLIRCVRTDPDQQYVLHDALLSRYGDDYEAYVARALRYAKEYGRRWGVLVSPSRLADAERGRPMYSWAERRRTEYSAIPFRVQPVNPFAPEASRHRLTKTMRRAVFSFVAMPREEELPERAYEMRGYDRFRSGR